MPVSTFDFVKTNLAPVVFSTLFVAVLLSAGVGLAAQPAQLFFWSILGLVALVLVFASPCLLITALLFVGSFKTKAAEGISLVDPTAVALMLLVAAIAAQVLLRFSSVKLPSLRSLLRRQGGAVISFFLFVGVVAASYFYSPSQLAAATKLTRFGLVGSTLFLAPLFLIITEVDLRHFLWSCIGVSCLLGIRILFNLFQVPEEVGDSAIDITQILEAQLIGVSILALLYAPIVRGKWRPLALACALFLAVSMMAAAARGPIFAILIVLALSACWLRPAEALLSRTVLTISIAAIVLVGAFAYTYLARLPAAREKFQEKTLELESTNGMLDPNGTAGMRLQYYKAAAEGFLHAPALGHGVGSWGLYYYGEDRVDYPHNLLLEVAFEEGGLGLIALLWFLWTVLLHLRKILQHDEERLVFLAPVLAFCLLVSMTSGDLDRNRLLWFWSGMSLAAARLVRRVRQTSRAAVPSQHRRVTAA